MKKYYTLLLASFMIVAINTSYAAEDTKNNDPLTFSKGNTTAKIGGFVTLTIGSYLEGATTSGNDFPVSTIAMDPAQSDESRLVVDPTSTRLNLTISQKTEALGDVKLFIETDFRGSGNTLFLRCATLELKGFTIGQTWSLMTDAKALAPTIDISGTNSRTFFRTQMIAYRYSLENKLTLGASLEYPVVKTTVSSSPEIRVPDLIAYLEKSGRVGRIKIAGVWRTLQYCSGENVNNTNGWGAQLSGSLNITNRLTLFAQGIYGQSISTFINDLTKQSYDIIEDNGTVYDSTPMWGWGVSAKYKLSDKFALCGNFSRAAVEIDKDYSAIASTYKSGQYISATLFYYPLKNIITGVEYLNGGKYTYNDDFARAQRINMMIRHLF